MAKKPLEILTESMFYVLLSLLGGAKCGTEIAAFVSARTEQRVLLGPGTLYTILAKFEEEKLICETQVEGRRRIYQITEKGYGLYCAELERLRACVRDAEGEEGRMQA